MRPYRCSNSAVSTLRAGDDDAITGKKCRFLHRRAAGATKDRNRKRKNSTVNKENERNLDGHASDPHGSIRVTAASLVQRSIRPHSATKLFL